MSNDLIPPKKRGGSKYNSKKVEINGVVFDSIKEGKRYFDLKIMEMKGEISDLKMQVYFVLAPSVQLKGELRKKPDLRYIADFTYIKDGELIIEDVKSHATKNNAEYRIKKHLMKTVLGLDISEY